MNPKARTADLFSLACCSSNFLRTSSTCIHLISKISLLCIDRVCTSAKSPAAPVLLSAALSRYFGSVFLTFLGLKSAFLDSVGFLHIQYC